MRRGNVNKPPADRHWKGCYVISRNNQDTVHKLGVAWGEGGLFNRLKNYKICMPYKDEYYVQYLFICQTKEKAKALERKILARTDKLTDTQIAEQVFDDESKVKGRRSKEYRFSAKKDDLTQLLIAELNDHTDLWRYAVIFGKNGWKIQVSPGKINFQRPAASRTDKPSFADADKPHLKVDSFIPGVAAPVTVKKGKVVWVVNKGRKKGELKAIKGRLDGLVDKHGIYIHFDGKKGTWAYKKNEIFSTEADAKADFASYR